MDLARYRKALVAAVSLILNVIAACLAVGGIIPASWLPFVTAFVLVAGSYGVYATPNEPDNSGV